MLLKSLLKAAEDSKPVVVTAEVKQPELSVEQSSPVVAVDLPLAGNDSQDPEPVVNLFLCPYCYGNDLKDDPRGLRCNGCLKLAWYWNGLTFIRADQD